MDITRENKVQHDGDATIIPMRAGYKGKIHVTYKETTNTKAVQFGEMQELLNVELPWP
jgi:hypothetical protein